MNFDDLIGLARLTFRNPAQAVRVLQSLDLPLSARWMVLAVSVLLSTVLMVLVIQARPDAVLPFLRDLPLQPVAYAVLQLAALGMGSWLLTVMGRAVGGQADFADVLLIVAWIEILMLVAQAVQGVVLMVSPLLSSLIGLVATVAIAWVSIQLLRAVHGIANPLVVILGVVGAFMLTVFVLSIIAAAFGLIPELPAEVQS